MMSKTLHKGMMVSLPITLILRFKSVIPEGERSKIAAELIEKEVERREHDLFLAAKGFAEDPEYINESKILEATFGGDGLENV